MDYGRSCHVNINNQRSCTHSPTRFPCAVPPVPLLPTFRSGTPLDEKCDASAHKLSASAKRYLLIDTNVALHQVRTLRGRHQGAGKRGADARGQTPGGRYQVGIRAGTRGQRPGISGVSGRQGAGIRRGQVPGAHMGRYQGAGIRGQWPGVSGQAAGRQ